PCGPRGRGHRRGFRCDHARRRGTLEPARPPEIALWRSRLAHDRRERARRHARRAEASRVSVRALIADDEAHLAEHLRTRLAALWPALEVLPIAANGLDALRRINDEEPEVAFLVFRMPGLT